MKYSLPTLALAAAVVATPLPAASPVAPTSFKIANIVSGGSGCPQGSIDIEWSDNKVLPIYFNRAFTASVGPASTDPASARKNCQLNLALQYDSGFSFSVYSADYTGWADLDASITGSVKVTYYFSGETEQRGQSESGGDRGEWCIGGDERGGEADE
ncbi:hypothetical protein ACEQ8H_001706 [Pleosporales sp. CAS-2024a]